METNKPSLDSTRSDIVFVNDTIKVSRMHSGVREGLRNDTTIDIINGIGTDIVDSGNSGTAQEMIVVDTDNHLLDSVESDDQGLFSVSNIGDSKVDGGEWSEINEVCKG